MHDTFHWLDVDRIGEEMADAHPALDPMRVKFTELRRLVEALPGFVAQAGHPVNEKILEAIQMAWLDEHEDRPGTDEDEE